MTWPHIAVALLLSVVVVTAEEPPPEPAVENEILVLTADEAARLARAHADAALAARAAKLVSEANARITTAVLYPNLSAEARYTHNGDRPETDLGALGSRSVGNENDYLAAVRGDQLLWSFGRISAALDAAAALDVQSEADLETILRNAEQRARIAVAGIQLATAERQVGFDRVAQRQSELEDAEARRAAGDVTELDVREARLSLIQSENELRLAELALVQSSHELTTAIAAEDVTVDVPTALSRPGDLPLLIDAARQGIETGPEVASLYAQATLRDAEYAESRGRSLPELRAFGEYSQNGPEIDDMEDQWSVGLSLTWNFYNGGADLATMDRAAREAARVRRVAIGEIRARQQEFNDLVAELRSLNERILAEAESVELAAANYEDARAQYRAGVITQTRVGDANLAITFARIRYLRLIFDEIVAAEALRVLVE